MITLPGPFTSRRCRAKLCVQKNGPPIPTPITAQVIFLGDVHETGVLFNPGVIHQDVEPSQRRHRFFHHAARVGDHAHVGLNHRRPPPHRRDLRARRFGALAVLPVVDRHVRALFGQPQSDALPDSLVAARDQCVLSAEFHPFTVHR